MAVDTTRRYTLAEVYEFPDDGHRYELLDGVLHVAPLARRRHQWVVFRITYRLGQWVEVHGGTVYPGVNVDLSDDTHLEPDVAYSASEDTSGLAFTEAPELIVEVSSASTKRFDLGAKKDRYAGEGTRELWFVDLDDDVVLQFALGPDRRFGPPRTHARGDRFASALFPGLVLDVDDLLGQQDH
jgi:Uma2 family endonuclease